MKSEKSQPLMNIFCMIPLYEISKRGKSINTTCKLLVAHILKGKQEGKKEVANGHITYCWGDKICSKINYSDGENG